MSSSNVSRLRILAAFLAGLVASLALLRGPLVPRPTPSFDVGATEAFWWIDVHAERSATAWIGPNLEASDGLTWRPWVLQYSVLGADQPLLWLQSCVRADGAEPVSLEGQALSVRLQPVSGLTWREVRSTDDLLVEVGDGLG